MSKLNYEEESLQKAIVQFLKLTAKPGVVYYHVPNGVSSSKRTGARMKAMGLLAGVGDLYFLLPSGFSCWLELKAPKKYPTPEQKAFRDAVRASGGHWEFTRDLDDALRILKEWGVL